MGIGPAVLNRLQKSPVATGSQVAPPQLSQSDTIRELAKFFAIRRIDPISVISALPHIHIRSDDICHRGAS